MIIKRWNTSLSNYEELYPKTILARLYEADGATPLFNQYGKIAATHLPDSVFDSLYYYAAINSSANLSTLAGTAVAGATSRSPKGFYWVISSTPTTITANPSTATQVGAFWYKTNFIATEGSSAPTSVVLEVGDWIIFDELVSGSGSSGDPYIVRFATVNNTYEVSSASSPGIVKIGSDTANTASQAALGSTNGRTYLTQVDSAGKLVVNVPWTDTTYSVATNSALGTIKLGATNSTSRTLEALGATADRNYPVALNLSTQQAFVNVPWTDTTYNIANASDAGLVKLGNATPQSEAASSVTNVANRSYAIQLNASNQMVVNVPWTDNNTTYSAASTTNLGLIKLGDDTQQSVAGNSVTATSSRSYKLQINSSGQGLINVPWTDTTYAEASTSVLGLVKYFSATEQTVAANSVTATSNRTYGIQPNSASHQMVVNVPWTDTTYNVTSKGGLELSGTSFKMTTPFYCQAADPVATIDGTIWFDI